jgi:hypothetical protein
VDGRRITEFAGFPDSSLSGSSSVELSSIMAGRFASFRGLPLPRFTGWSPLEASDGTPALLTRPLEAGFLVGVLCEEGLGSGKIRDDGGEVGKS